MKLRTVAIVAAAATLASACGGGSGDSAESESASEDSTPTEDVTQVPTAEATPTPTATETPSATPTEELTPTEEPLPQWNFVALVDWNGTTWDDFAVAFPDRTRDEYEDQVLFQCTLASIEASFDDDALDQDEFVAQCWGWILCPDEKYRADIGASSYTVAECEQHLRQVWLDAVAQ